MFCCGEFANTRNGKYGLFYFCKKCGRTKSFHKSKIASANKSKNDWSDLNAKHWYDETLDWEQHY